MVIAKQPSGGLVRTIGRWSLTALMVNSIIGASIFGLPSVLAAKLGGFSPLGYLEAGSAMLIVAACIAEVSSRYEETGGLYLYARDAFGRLTGLVIAWLTWLTRIAAPAAAADLFVTYAGQFFPLLTDRRGQILVLVILIGHLAILNYIGVKIGKTVSNVFTGVKVSFLLFFVVSGLVALVVHPSLRVPLSFAAVPAKNWFEAILLLVYAYGGFEGALFVGGESQNPRRDTPIALLVAMAVVGGIYITVQYVVIATLPEAAISARPLADAAQRFLGAAGATALGFAALVSTYGFLSANLLHAPRITYALGEHGDFPKVLAAVHPRFRTPHVSILLYAVLLFTFAALGTFRWNAMLSAVSRLTIYGAMALAVPVLRRRDPAGASFRLPVPYLFSAAGMVFAAVLLTRMSWGEFLLVGGTVLVALLNWLVVRKRGNLPREDGSGKSI
jgi:APA family basic amino acid/polyamine antiporter